MAGITWWTPDRLGVLRQMAAEGLQSPEISRHLSRRYHRRLTSRAVRNIAARHGIPLRAGPPLGNTNAASA